MRYKQTEQKCSHDEFKLNEKKEKKNWITTKNIGLQ